MLNEILFLPSHSDLKPENLLLDADLNIKVIDFGFVNLFDPEDYLNTFCGSPFYASPEMILGKQYVGPEVDVWSLGVILFALLGGHLPFRDSNSTELYRKIANAIYTMPDYFSPTAKDLIKRMLTVNPQQRITIEEIRNHPWITEGINEQPDSYIPPRPKLTTLDDAIINKMTSYGFEKENLTATTLNNPHSPAFAVYHLIHEQMDREKERNRKHLMASAMSLDNGNARTMDPIKESDGGASGRPSECGNSTLHVNESNNTSNSASPAGSQLSVYAPNAPTGGSYNQLSTTSQGQTGASATNSLTPAQPALGGSYNQLSTNTGAGTSLTPLSAALQNRRGSLRTGYRTTTTTTTTNGPSSSQNGHTEQISVSHNELSSKTHQPSSSSTQSTAQAIPVRKLQRKSLKSLTNVAVHPSSDQSSTTLSNSPNATGSTLPQIVVGGSDNEVKQQPASATIPEVPKNFNPNRRQSLNEAVLKAFESVSSSVSKLRSKVEDSNTVGVESRLPKRTSISSASTSAPTAASEPRTIKVMFGVDTTSTKPVPEIISEIERALTTNATLSFSRKGFKFGVTHEKVELELEICKIHKTNMHGLVFKRIKGSIWNYQNVCQALIASWRL